MDGFLLKNSRHDYKAKFKLLGIPLLFDSKHVDLSIFAGSDYNFDME